MRSSTRGRGRGKNYKFGGRGGSGGQSRHDNRNTERPERNVCKYFTISECGREGCRFDHILKRHADVKAHNDILKCIAIWENPDGIKIFTGSKDGSWKLWETSTWTMEATQQMGGEVEVLKVKNNFLFCGFESETVFIPKVTVGMVKAWNLSSPDKSFDFIVSDSMPYAHAYKVQAIEIGADIVITGGCEGIIRVWKFNETSTSFVPVTALEGHVRAITDLELMDSGILASASLDKTIRFWDPQSGSCAKVITANEEGHKDAVTKITSCKIGDLTFLMSGGLDNTIKVWDSQGNFVYTETVGSKVLALSPTSDANGAIFLLVGNDNGVLSSRSLPEFKLLVSLEQFLGISHSGAIRCIESGAHHTFYSGGADGKMMVWQWVAPVLKE